MSTLINNIWFTVLLWSVLYFGDYYLTIYTASQFKTRLAEHLDFERSFELNPIFEEDVNKLRWISPRFLVLWLLISAFLVLAWWLAGLIQLPQAFQFIAGELILLEFTVHLRHFRNLAIIKTYRNGALSGHLRYAYWFGLQLSAWELFSFAVLYILLAILESSWFFAGGVLGSLILAFKHRSRSEKSLKESAQE